jgi:hypothetical protein
MAAADSSIVMVQMTLSQIVLELSWDNENSASSDFTHQHRNKSADIWQIEQVANSPYALATF